MIGLTMVAGKKWCKFRHHAGRKMIWHIQQLKQALFKTMRHNYCRGRDNNCGWLDCRACEFSGVRS
jgi:hypothetical protein